MQLDNAVKLLAKLNIRDLRTATPVPFRLNANQHKAVEMLKLQERKGHPLRWITLKARRVGMSSLTDGLFFCHILSQPLANAKIVAHLDESVSALFQVPTGLVKDIRRKVEPSLFLEPTKTYITACHDDGDAILSIATAGSAQGGRGEGLSALHLSEASMYRGEESFISLLNAVPNDPSTLISIESTANGKSGIGETFYKFWNDSEQGHTDYIPVFLSWLDDASCVRHADELSKPCPPEWLQDEKELKRRFKATPEQLAWRRWCIRNNCRSYVNTFHAEYPAFAEEAFVATGNPAFTKDELSRAAASIEDPILVGNIERVNKEIKIVPNSGTNLSVWEKPKPGHVYTLGADAARGEETGDFAAITVLNATTMEVAARLQARISPQMLADACDMLGRYFNRAMVIIELTGNLGLHAQAILRDNLHYPNLYLRKGKDDKSRYNRGNNFGWETNWKTREMAFTAFRESLVENNLKVKDKVTVAQMEGAQRTISGKWEVKFGHDDVLFSQLLANIAAHQYPPARRLFSSKPEEPDAQMPKLAIKPGPPLDENATSNETVNGLLRYLHKQNIARVLTERQVRKRSTLEGV